MKADQQLARPMKIHCFAVADELHGFKGLGYYVPELAKLIYEKSKNLTSHEKTNFKGFMVGNPVTDSYNDNWGYVKYVYYHAMISDETYAELKKECNFTHQNDPVSHKCIQLLYYEADDEYGNMDPYSIYAPACISNTSANSTGSKFGRNSQQMVVNPILSRLRRGYDPCSHDYSLVYFNRPDVQKALHANTKGNPCVGCSDPLFENWQGTAATVLPIYLELLDAGLRLWVFRFSSFLAIPPNPGSCFGHQIGFLIRSMYS